VFVGESDVRTAVLMKCLAYFDMTKYRFVQRYRNFEEVINSIFVTER